jgi:hypothetical protein
MQKPFKAQISFHGVQQTMEVPVSLKFESANHVVAECHFSISLEAFKIDRPSLMFVKVDDQVKVDANLVFSQP